MKYLEIMEAIPHRPRNLRAYLTSRIKELGQMLDDLAQANGLIRDGQDGESVIRYALRSGIEDTEHAGSDTTMWRLDDLNLDQEFGIERLKQTLETYLQHGSAPGYDFLRYVMSALDDVTKYANPGYREQYAQAFKLLPYAEAGFEKYGFRSPDDDADPDYIAAQKLVAGYRLKAKVFARIEPLEADLRVKMGVVQRMKNHYGSAESVSSRTRRGRDVVPRHGVHEGNPPRRLPGRETDRPERRR